MIRTSAVLGALLTLAGLVALSEPAGAHSTAHHAIGQYAELELYADSVRVQYLLDYGSVPAELELNAVDPNQDNQVEPEERAAYLEQKTGEVLANLKLEWNGTTLPLEASDARVAFGDGGHGGSTARVSWSLFARYPADAERPESHLVVWNDGNHEGTRGWKEIRFTPRGWVQVTKSSVAEPDRSVPLGEHRHHRHGADVIPQDTKGWAQFRVTGADPAPAGDAEEAPTASDELALNEGTVFGAEAPDEEAPPVTRNPLALALLALGTLAILAFAWFRR